MTLLAPKSIEVPPTDKLTYSLDISIHVPIGCVALISLHPEAEATGLLGSSKFINGGAYKSIEYTVYNPSCYQYDITKGDSLVQLCLLNTENIALKEYK